MKDRKQVPDVPARAWSGIRLGRLFGVEVIADWSLLVIFALVLFSLGNGVFPEWHPGWSSALTWGVAAAAAVAFFASVLMHEMAHALVARVQGIPIRRITLFMFGGMAHMEREPPSPRSEFLMAIVGPITSVVIGLVAFTLAFFTVTPETAELMRSDPRASAMAMGPVPTVLLWLGPINVLLGVFNLVPGFPLDGGRVLRSLLWWLTGDLRRATRWASGVGAGFGLLLIVAGAAMIFGFHVPVLGTGLGPGLWSMLIGWFLRSAAHGSYHQLLIRESLEDATASDVMRSKIVQVEADTSVQEFVDDYLFELEQRFFPVVDGGRFIGMVSGVEAKHVTPEERESARVREIMTPATRLETLEPSDTVIDHLTQITRQGVVPVVSDGKVRGLLTSTDLQRRVAFFEHQAST